mgnify:CR=1 FL=1
MEGIKGGEEGVLTSLDKLAARYSRWQRDRSFTRFQRRPRCSSIFFPIVRQKIFTRHARWVAVERFGCQENGASFSWREIRNSKSDVRSWSNDICASGEDHVANRVNDLNLKFNSVSTNLTCVSSVFALNFVKQSTKFVEEWESSCKWIREDRANFRRCRWYPWLVWKINVDNVRECVNWSVIVRFASERIRIHNGKTTKWLVRWSTINHWQDANFPTSDRVSASFLFSTRISVAHCFVCSRKPQFLV